VATPPTFGEALLFFEKEADCLVWFEEGGHTRKVNSRKALKINALSA
jgi:hypothetical protein